MFRQKLSCLFLVAMVMSQMVIIGSTSSMAEEDAEEGCAHPNRIAVLETDYGTIKFVLYENLTPITTENFIGLAESGHYDGVVFHRIVDDFVIQTGDGGGGATIPLETHPNATHIDGAVGMARSSEPDSASDQFYICDGPQHGLDGDYAVFGVVVEGMEVVRKIAEVPVYGENDPKPGIAIPSLWYNMGMPKEDVFVQKAYIENPASNETTGDVETTARPVSGGSLWILAILAIPAAGAAYYIIQKKEKNKSTSEKEDTE